MRLAVAALLALVACNAELGRSSEAQAIGSRGLSYVTTDNVTLEGSGTTTTPAKLKAVQVDGVTVTGTGSAGSPLAAPWEAVSGYVFADGFDGDVVISGDTNLTRDMLYDDLTVDGATLSTLGHRVFVAGTLTFLNSAQIAHNGNAASGSSAGTGPSGSNCVGSISGGAGGTTGVGSTGGSSTLAVRGCSTTTPTGGTAGSPTGQSGGVCRGAAGGRGSGGNGAAGGGLSLLAASDSDIHTFHDAIECMRRTNQTPVTSGSGGSGGGGSAGGNGGGGGASGGTVIVAARKFTATSCHADGCIQARGGAGGDADPAGNGGGGGGGSGGLIVLVVGTGSFPSTNITGGAKGNKAGTGGDGGVGGDGIVVTFRIGN